MSDLNRKKVVKDGKVTNKNRIVFDLNVNVNVRK